MYIDDELLSFLNNIKLPQYYEVFKLNNFIDNKSICKIKDENQLKDIGIDKLFHRKKIIENIKLLMQTM